MRRQFENRWNEEWSHISYNKLRSIEEEKNRKEEIVTTRIRKGHI